MQAHTYSSSAGNKRNTDSKRPQRALDAGTAQTRFHAPATMEFQLTVSYRHTVKLAVRFCVPGAARNTASI